MTDKLDLVFEEFTNLLNARFSGHIFTKEDAIRYTFFYAICQCSNLKPEDIILESKHPSIEGDKEIDMLIPEKDDSHELVFEFKYDVKRSSVSPRPYKAGHLFADIFRLLLYKRDHQDSRCFLIYVTDFEQANYMSKDENRLDDFFNLLAGQKLQINSDYVKNHADTFVKAASTYGIHECQISSCLNVDLTNSHFVRIYEIFC